MDDKAMKTVCMGCLMLSVITLLTTVIFSCIILAEICTVKEMVVEASKTESTTIIVEKQVDIPEETTTQVVETTTKPKETTTKPSTVEDDIELLALVAVAEAEGESEYGKRLVIDTVLNRVDHPKFPNTIRGVVYQKNQFSSMWNGRTKRCVVTDEVRQLVKEELASRTNKDVIFFQMGGYSKYGKSLFKEGSHYFSAY